MGWEKGRYYTRSKKVDGRVLREYVGRGYVAQLAAQLDGIERERRQLARAGFVLERTKLADLDRPLVELQALANLAARAALVATGHHQHKRGEWRRKKRTEEGSDMTAEMTSADEWRGANELRKLYERASKGDASALPALRRVLQDPKAVDAFGGNLARQAEKSLIEAMAGNNLAFAEALTRKAELLRDELAGLEPTAIERLLVERVVACWLQVYEADIRYAQGQGNLSPCQVKLYQHRMTQANRRYLSALKTLATVRKKAVPVLLQVNIARKQVNVAGVTGAPKVEGPDQEAPDVTLMATRPPEEAARLPGQAGR